MTASGRVPALDGLRAVAVLIVIVGHLLPPNSFWIPGADGVSLFFAISGFIITTLLIREHGSTGRVSLGRFYARRSLRLWPALWIYLLIGWLLGLAGVVAVEPDQILGALFFVSDYVKPVSIVTGHTWSLSVEEQFYLLWPPLLIWMGHRRAPRWLVAAILVTPLVRAATYAAVPSWRGYSGFHFHERYDALAAGCLLALLWPRLAKMAARRGAAVVATSVAVIVASAQIGNTLGGVAQFVTPTVMAMGYAGVIAGAVVWAPAVLDSRPMRHVGLVSYSLYLWQNIFTVPGYRIVDEWWVSVLFLVAAAELSYWLVERPTEGLRRRFGVAPVS